MNARIPTILVGVAAVLTTISGALFLVALATNIGGGGPYAFLMSVYPVCLVPAVLLVLATVLLLSKTTAPQTAAYLAIVGGMLSIALAWAGFWAGAVLAVTGGFLILRSVPAPGVGGSGASAARPSGSKWIVPVGLLLVTLVVVILVGPQTIGASFVTTADLVNDPSAYDLQAVYVGGTGGTSLSYSVVTVTQGANCPLGYAYLLNGYANDSGQVYWYQVGLGYDWGGGTFSSSGWAMVYEVFGPTGNSVFPSTPGAGTADFSGPVSVGDTVDLSLSVGASAVTMAATDANSHASASESYSQSGSQPFGGGVPPQFTGFFTGLMTECYTSSSGTPTLTHVAYTDQGTSQSMGGVFVDEINYSWGRLPYLPAVALAPKHSAWNSLLLPSNLSFQAYGLTLVYNSTGFATESSS
jgi:hypothetical protein